MPFQPYEIQADCIHSLRFFHNNTTRRAIAKAVEVDLLPIMSEVVNLLFTGGMYVSTMKELLYSIIQHRVQNVPPPCPILVYHFNEQSAIRNLRIIRREGVREVERDG